MTRFSAIGLGPLVAWVPLAFFGLACDTPQKTEPAAEIESSAVEQIENAKAVCDSCDAKDPCLDFALTTNQDSGIWGGTSEEERRKLRRQWLSARRRAS